MGYVTWPRPFQGHFVIRRLGLAMFNPQIKLEMSTITCNKEMKAHAKCKNFRFEPPFGVVCVIVRLAVLIQYRRVTHTQTHRETDRQTDGHPMIAITRAKLPPRG